MAEPKSRKWCRLIVGCDHDGLKVRMFAVLNVLDRIATTDYRGPEPQERREAREFLEWIEDAS